MFKKFIIISVILSTIIFLVSCIGGIVTPPQDNGNGLQVEEEEDFNVSSNEGGTFKLSDGAELEVLPNSLSGDCGIKFSKISYDLNKDRETENQTVFYKLEIIGNQVFFLTPIKLILPISSDTPEENAFIISVFDNGSFGIIQGEIISKKSLGNFISAEISKLGTFTSCLFSSSIVIKIAQVAAESYNFYKLVKGDYEDDDCQSLKSLLEDAEIEEKEAYDYLFQVGLTKEDGEKILLGCVDSFETKLFEKENVVALIIAAVKDTYNLIVNVYKINKAGIAVLDYMEKKFKLEAAEYFYDQMALEVETSLANSTGEAPLEVELDGWVSNNGTKPYTYYWDFGNGETSKEYTDNYILPIRYIYKESGEFYPILYVEDKFGLKGEAKASKVTVQKGNQVTLPAPTGVTASDGTYTDRVYTNWNSVTGASYYKVYRATSVTGTKTAITSWQSNRYYSDYDITPGTHYFYFIKAASSSSGTNESAYSASDEGWAPPSGTTLPAPTGVTASDGTYTDRVYTNWNSVTGASYYKVYRATSVTGTKTAITSWQSNRYYSDYDITPGTHYFYFIKAASSSSGANESPYSGYDEGWAKPENTPPSETPVSAPTGLKASNGEFRWVIQVLWYVVDGATHYRLYRSESSGGTKTPITNWQTGNGHIDNYEVDEDKIYYYWVKAATSDTGENESPYSDYDEGWVQPEDYTPPSETPVSAPTGVDASDGTYTNSIEVSWNSVSGASYYKLYRADSPTAEKSACTNWNYNLLEVSEQFVPPGTHYFYFVRAATSSNGDDASPFSDYDEGWTRPEDYTPPSFAIRDIGPAGGYIFYDKGYDSSGWRYLEAAPVSTEWIGGNSPRWGSYGTLIGGTLTGTGTGQSNTTTIVTWLNSHSETGCAAQLCDALVYGGYNDWFLPSKGELNLMYKNLKVYDVGGFADNFYCSSSEYDANNVWVQSFTNGSQWYTEKYYKYFVRAVRAF